jgi:hypothetical protein
MTLQLVWDLFNVLGAVAPLILEQLPKQAQGATGRQRDSVEESAFLFLSFVGDLIQPDLQEQTPGQLWVRLLMFTPGCIDSSTMVVDRQTRVRSTLDSSSTRMMRRYALDAGKGDFTYTLFSSFAYGREQKLLIMQYTRGCCRRGTHRVTGTAASTLPTRRKPSTRSPMP